METKGLFHLVYQPACEGIGGLDRIIDVIQTTDLADVMLQLKAAPDAIAMQLDAETLDEVHQELADLGFTG